MSRLCREHKQGRAGAFVAEAAHRLRCTTATEILPPARPDAWVLLLPSMGRCAERYRSVQVRARDEISPEQLPKCPRNPEAAPLTSSFARAGPARRHLRPPVRARPAGTSAAAPERGRRSCATSHARPVHARARVTHRPRPLLVHSARRPVPRVRVRQSGPLRPRLPGRTAAGGSDLRRRPGCPGLCAPRRAHGPAGGGSATGLYHDRYRRGAWGRALGRAPPPGFQRGRRPPAGDPGTGSARAGLAPCAIFCTLGQPSRRIRLRLDPDRCVPGRDGGRMAASAGSARPWRAGPGT